ncbi:MAG: biotin carboxyl carrier protein [Flavobacteriales bacterium]|jgi:biotin carboxyl carrier protein
MYKAKVNDQEFEFNFSDDKGLKGTVNGDSFDMDLAKQGSVHHLIHEHKSFTIELVELNKEDKFCILKVNNQELTISIEDKYDALLKQLGMENMNSQKVNEVKAPMPGLVLNILVEPGQQISKGDGLFVLEAMKMENIIKSPTDAIVKSIEVEKGIAVEKNQVLVKFE